MTLLSQRLHRPAPASAAVATGRLWPSLLAAALGLALLAGVGFAPAAVLHEAAHDGRHAFAFPCH